MQAKRKCSAKSLPGLLIGAWDAGGFMAQPFIGTRDNVCILNSYKRHDKAGDIGFGENGKRYQLHQPASRAFARLAGTYPYNPNPSLIRHPRSPTDYNNGATLPVARMVHIRFFHRICNLARPVETPLCKMCFYSYTSRGCNHSENDYIFKMKDLERFLGRQSK
jgi:hypothetical protein